MGTTALRSVGKLPSAPAALITLVSKWDERVVTVVAVAIKGKLAAADQCVDITENY